MRKRKRKSRSKREKERERESNKDLMVGLLADACCERLEHYISQVILYDSIIKLKRVNYLACV